MNSPGPAESVRVFVAVELPPEVTGVLGVLATALRQEGLSSLRLAAPQGVHLTLKFLGQVSLARLEGVTGALDRVAQSRAPFAVELRGLGGFPTLERPQILWVGLDGESEGLQGLAGAVEEALTPLGFPPANRGFTPHITLARLRQGAPPVERRSAGESLVRLLGQERATLAVEGISLIRSLLLPQGARYSRLHRAALVRP